MGREGGNVELARVSISERREAIAAMERYVCVHGHFYQPPRENPWLEAVEIQDSAYPYHDWNERITTECYAPNGTSRILDSTGRIVKIVNNFSRVSFDFGPTLLSWLKARSPETYRTIQEADRESQGLFSGHGAAMAQGYNHMILPLANARDKRTQVAWGIRDFQHHFGRMPEGMWLPETAVDLETLDIMAELGIRFTLFAPWQANSVRRLDSRFRRDVSGGLVDTTMAYQIRLPSGRTIAAFFYDGPIAGDVAFGDLLTSGERFARRLLDGLSEARPWPQIIHIATDGETYGHHHTYGDMALAYALNDIESGTLARLTNYGEYLEKHPPTHEVEINENTSWSCAHGVERWRSNCGCRVPGPAEWNQSWRTPLREAMDWLRDTVAEGFEEKGRRLLRDPWEARDAYIDVILNRAPETLDIFLREHALRRLNDEERVTAVKLLEMQRHAMLMYTSCGWFFNDVSGIETVQILQYAGRVLQLGWETLGLHLQEGFLARVEAAHSNIPERGDGRALFEKFVSPAVLNWEKLGAHYALSSLFTDYTDQAQVYSFAIERMDEERFDSGRARLAVGRARVTNQVTTESSVLEYGALYSGDHTLNAGVREVVGENSYQSLVSDLGGAFRRTDFLQVLRFMDRHFGESNYSLKSLFRDEQREVLEHMMGPIGEEAEMLYRQLYEHHGSLMRLLSDLNVPATDLTVPLPKALHSAAEVVLSSDLRRALDREPPDLKRAAAVVEDAKLWRVVFDTATLAYAFKRAASRLAERIRLRPHDVSLLQTLEGLVDLARSMGYEADLWKAQNTFYGMLHTVYPEVRSRAEKGDVGARRWVKQVNSLGEKLWVRVN